VVGEPRRASFIKKNGRAGNLPTVIVYFEATGVMTRGVQPSPEYGSFGN
jgi:hypothetical protein